MPTTNPATEGGANQIQARKPKASATKPLKVDRKKSTSDDTIGRLAVPETKTAIVLKKLRAGKGASIAQLGEATGWQAHSVRGFLSATVRKKLALVLVSEVGKDGIRRYRIAAI